MQQAPVRPSVVLDYATPIRARPRRRWLFAAFAVGLFFLEDVLGARLTPPGWPVPYDYALMLLLPVGALIMARISSLPGSAIGMYGLIGAGTFLLGQISDRDLYLRLAESGGVSWFVINWLEFIVASWLICRLSVLARRRSAE